MIIRDLLAKLNDAATTGNVLYSESIMAIRALEKERDDMMVMRDHHAQERKKAQQAYELWKTTSDSHAVVLEELEKYMVDVSIFLQRGEYAEAEKIITEAFLVIFKKPPKA